jgi:tRNA (5-methylaminomethyl-2-thiouridylate)-methyltransferase
MKFGLMYEKAKELGCDYIATGHYAKTEYCEKYNQYVLKKSNAGKKDQSYVLYNLPQDMIDKVLFPLANFESKDEIRKIAKEHNLIVANKPDSEDICFIPDGNYKKFLEQNSDLKAKEGNIVTRQGKVIGKHTGLYKYTIGQRKGLGISNPVPLFVIGFNQEKNELIVGEEKELYSKQLNAIDVNWMIKDKLKEKIQVSAKTRYSTKESKAIIYPIENGKMKVEFIEPQRAITPGQSIVFYDGDIVLGGGKIEI